MAYKTMYFSRSSSGYNTQGTDDQIDYTPDSSISFGSGYKCTYFWFEVDGGLTSATSSARNHDAALVVECSNGAEYEIWSGTLYLPKKGTSGYDVSFSGSIPSSYQVPIATNGIKDLWLRQDGSYSLRGTTGSGSLEIEYVSNMSLGTPGTPTITQNTNAATYTISWSAASASGGTPEYNPYDINSGYVSSWGTSTSRTINIPNYDTSHTWEIDARLGDLFTTGGRASKTFYKPSLNAPTNLKINSSTSYTGQTAPLTWSQGALNYTSGTRTYEIYKGSTLVHTTGASATSYTIPESTTKGWGTSAVTLKIRGKGTSLGNTASGSTIYSSYTSTVSYTYRASVSTHPSNLKINNAASYTGATAPLTWSAAAFSGGQTPTYSIRINGTQLTTTTNTSYTIPESTTKTYSSAVTITVVATGGGATSNATSGVTYTYSPTITAPSNLTISAATGSTATLSWTAGSLSNGGTVTYSIRKDGTQFTTTTNTSYTIPEATAKSWGATAVSLTVVATGAGKTSTASNAVSFTYKPPYKTVKYYDGSKWVECTVHYYNGSSFQQVDPYYYTSSTAYTGTSHQ